MKKPNAFWSSLSDKADLNCFLFNRLTELKSHSFHFFAREFHPLAIRPAKKSVSFWSKHSFVMSIYTGVVSEPTGPNGVS
jgi:hypothetical protein